MREIVYQHLPGIALIHLPTPPPQIRAITDHVYFLPRPQVADVAGVLDRQRDRHAFLRRLARPAAGALGHPGGLAVSDRDPPRRDNRTDHPAEPRRAAAFRASRSRRPQPDAANPAPAPGSAGRLAAELPTAGALALPSGPGAGRRSSRSVPGLPGLRRPSQAWLDRQRTRSAQPPRQRAALARIDELFAPNANPLMRAAGPLLLLLGRLRAAAPAGPLREPDGPGRPVDPEIRARHRGRRRAGRSGQDGQVHPLRHGRRHRAEHPGRGPARVEPLQHARDVLRRACRRRALLRARRARQASTPSSTIRCSNCEHACLALGFQGRYRSEGGGFATLQQIQRNLYETLRRVRPRMARDLSPHWKGQALAARGAGCACRPGPWLRSRRVLLFGLLRRPALPAERRRRGRAGRDAGAQSAHADHASPARRPRRRRRRRRRPRSSSRNCSGSAPRWRPRSRPARSRCRTRPARTGSSINVGDCAALQFRAGDADRRSSRRWPTASAPCWRRKPAPIGIVGHTDTTPLSARPSPFKSNFDLSIARAKNVAAILKTGLLPRQRASRSTARAPTSPSPTTRPRPAGAQNRRVEILVQRTDWRRD